MIDAGGVPAVPAVSHPQPGPLFDRERLSTSRLGGVSRLSRLKYDLSHVRAHTRSRTHAHTLDNRRISRDSRDTPTEPGREAPNPSNRRPGWLKPQPGHPGHTGWSA